MRRGSTLLTLALAVLPLAACASGPGYSAQPLPRVTPAPSGSSAAPGPTAGVTSPLAALSPAAAGSSAPAPRRTAGSPATEGAPQATQPATRGPSPTHSALPPGATVGVAEVTGDRFSPSTVTVHVGDTVLVTDQDSIAPHTFTIGALHVDSGGMSQGQTFRYRFTTTGTYTFVCSYHQSLGMTGTLTVVS